MTAPPSSKPEARKHALKKESKVEVKSLSDVLHSVQIALDGYDDLFSDFDSSPYERRVLSDDFLLELRKRYVETGRGEFLVTFTVPGASRSEKTEAIVKKRLKDYFRTKRARLHADARELRKKGLTRIAAGATVLLTALTVASSVSETLESLLMVPSWFLLWSGFDRLLDAPKQITREIMFSDMFIKAKYCFLPEEDVVQSLGPRKE